MSDDAPRSTQGNRPDQRRGRGAPSWWDALQRTDLPDDPRDRDSVVDTAGWELPEGFPGPRARRGRLAVLASLATAVLVALAIAFAVWAATAAGRGPASAAAVIVAVPVALLAASLLVNLFGRRRH